jgi:mRNA-degrading endonuclease RelE of RelBE toxin-antitoxin system
MRARQLRFSSSARKFLSEIHEPLLVRIENALLAVADDPRSGKPLKGGLKGNHSYRVGDWRIVYSIEKNFIYIKDIRHRREAYRKA